MEDIRLNELVESNRVALGFLCGPGNFLSARQRRLIVDESVKAWSGQCQSCQTARRWVRHSHHESVFAVLAHGCARWQASWCQEDCVHALKGLRDLFPLLEMRDLYSVFAECVIVTSWACGLAASYLALGLDFPSLPVDEVDVPRDYTLFVDDFAKDLVKSDGFTPLIKKTHSTVPGVDPTWHKWVADGTDSPAAHVMLAPVDAMEWCNWWSTHYVKLAHVVRPWKPSKRVLLRSQMETLAASLTEALKCTF